MDQKLQSSRRIPFYLVAILIGMAGIVFSREIINNFVLRFVVVILSVSVPLFASGNMLARPSLSRLQRLLLVLGVVMLVSGAGFSISGLSDTMIEEEIFSKDIAGIAQFLGVASLLLGLFVVLYSVVRTGEDVEALGDRFWHLAEQINEGLLVSSADGRILLANKRIQDMFGVKEEDVLGQSTTVLARELKLTPVVEHFDRRAEGLASEYTLSCQICGEERRLLISGNPIFDRHGQYSGTLGLVRDVTDQYNLSQRLERYNRGLQQLVEEQTEKLRQSEERFRRLLETMNEGFLTLNANYRIRYANQRIREMLRVEREDLVGRDIFDFLDTASRLHLLNLLAQGAGLESAELRREVNFVTADNTLSPAMVAVSHIRETADEDARYSLVVTNVADLKNMQYQLEKRARELEKANEELRMHDRAKDSFLSNVSHELRTPLSTIQGYLDMFESNGLGELDVTQRGALKVMRRNVDRLIGQINEIIEFSRMEIRGVHLAMQLFSPARLIQESAAFIQPMALQKDLSLNVFTDDAIGPIWADREKIGQVLGILLNNAVKFSDPGGLIQVRLNRHGDDGIAISVSDTGIGISTPYHQRVFTKFFQVDASRSRRYGGTGIGLSIAKSIVEAHEGSIELRSARGEGSTFTIALPNTRFDRRFAESDAGLNNLSILAVAVGYALPTEIPSLLDEMGARVEVVESSFIGARRAGEISSDLILILDLPQHESVEAAISAFRGQPAVSDTPIIICTDRDVADDLDPEAMRPGVHSLEKPFGAVALARAIRHACFGEAAPVRVRHGGATLDVSAGRRVLIIDNDASMLEWIELALTRRSIACCCAPDPAHGLELVGEIPPEVVFLDIDVPETKMQDCLDAIRAAEVTRDAPIIVMTGAPQKKGALQNVAGVLHKPFTVEEMVEVIQNNAVTAHAPVSESERHGGTDSETA